MSKTTGAEINAKNTQQKEQSQAGESVTVENIGNTSVKRSEEQEQSGNLRIQSVTPFQPCSSSISDSSTTVNSNGAAACFLPVVLCIHQLQLLLSFQCLTSVQCGTNPFTSNSHHWIPIWTLPRPHWLSLLLHILQSCLQISYICQQLKLTLHSRLCQVVTKYSFWHLNDIVLQGPKLKSDLFTVSLVLIRFCCGPVALRCSIKERCTCKLSWNLKINLIVASYGIT